MPAHFHDAHNHLQDARFTPALATIVQEARAQGVRHMVVNGSCEQDWPDVARIARAWPNIIPCFGYHPWYVKERTPQWREALAQALDSSPGAAVGEIGLDRWVKDHDLGLQEEVFLCQWRLARERGLPASIHCLQAWGKLYDLLRAEPAPKPGFILHSYGGPREMVQPLASLGAYFSLPGYFAHERKVRQRETFRHVPLDRLLIETDAPDQMLPDELNRWPLRDSAGKPINHPANLVAVYEFAAELRGLRLDQLKEQVEQNFLRLFGSILI